MYLVPNYSLVNLGCVPLSLLSLTLSSPKTNQMLIRVTTFDMEIRQQLPFKHLHKLAHMYTKVILGKRK